MTNRTPGDWSLIPCSDGREIVCGKYRIAHVGYSVRFSPEEAIANGRLLAAAPKMHKALEDLLKLAEVALYDRDRDGAAYQAMLRDLGAAVTAGNKAIGRAEGPR